MSLNDLRTRWALRRLPRIVFLHLPKCGGSSVHTALSGVYTDRLTDSERHNRLLRSGPDRRAGPTLYSGHFDFASTRDLRADYNLVSIFREPRARLVSMYNFLHAHRLDHPDADVHRLHHLSHAHEIDAFFACEEVRAHPAINNGLTRSLSDVPLPFYRWEDAAEIPAQDDLALRLDEARRNLAAFRFIGQLSRMQAFLKAFEKHLRMPPLPEKRDQSLDTIMRERPTMRVIEPQKLHADQAGLLDALVAEDEALYAHAGQMFGWQTP